MEEITVSDGIPDSMHCLHEENKIAHWQRDDERQGMHPCSGHPVEIDGNVTVPDDLDRRATLTDLDTYDGWTLCEQKRPATEAH